MIEITLTDFELHMAAAVGTRRQIEAIVKELPDRHGFVGAGWNLHIEGAAGELAFAKALNKYWSGSVNTFKRGGDVGETIQIRTRSEHWHDLIVRAGDRDEDRFVLVTGQAPTFRIIGYISGRKAKQPQFEKTHGGRDAAYFVPQAELVELSA